LEYPTLDELKEKNSALYERWYDIVNSKYQNEFTQTKTLNDVYQSKAVYHPEFCKIVAITYATLYSENGTIKRFFKKIVNEKEEIVIATFFDVLHQLSSEGVKSTPQYFPTLCGHNITNYDIPMLVKRFLINKEKKEFGVNKQLPLIIKNCLNSKPWESIMVDTCNVWKFNGNDCCSLMLVADFLNLKKTVDLMDLPELSKFYWNTIGDKPEEALEFVALQSATQTNLVIQLMNELRQL